MNWRRWKHITKLDPDRNNPPELVEAVMNSGTDAIMISGTQGVTKEKIQHLLSMLEDSPVDVVLEPSHPGAVVEDIPLFVPSVLNSEDVMWVLGHHVRWLESYDVDWDMVVPEAYIVLNPDSTVARVTRARTSLSIGELRGMALVAQHYFSFPVVYVEYSGTYGDPEVVSAISDVLSEAVLFYGGGIDDGDKAREMLQYADAVVVGNVLYEKGVDAFLATVV